MTNNGMDKRAAGNTFIRVWAGIPLWLVAQGAGHRAAAGRLRRLPLGRRRDGVYARYRQAA